MAKNSKINLNELLRAVDTGDKEFYNRLDEEQKKEFSAWLVMRWTSSWEGDLMEYHLLLTNKIVNRDFSALNTHPGLQWKLITCVGNGSHKPYAHKWIKPGRKKGKNKLQEALSNIFPNMKGDELALFESIHTKDEMKQVFADAGYDRKEVKEFVK